MAAWIRKNLVLVAGIVLPVLLVAGFLLLQSAPALVGDPPRHDFLAAGYLYNPRITGDYTLTFEVEDGRLQGVARPIDDDNYRDRLRAELYRYDAREQRFIRLDWKRPDISDGAEETVRFKIPETAGLKLDRSARSPDGYSLEWVGYRGRGGLLGELFGFGYRPGNNWALMRNGGTFELPAFESGQYYGRDQLMFLGWVTGNGNTP